MKTFFLAGVALMGLTVLPATATAAPMAGLGANSAPASAPAPLIQVQHRRGGGGGGHRGGGHHGGDDAGAAAAGAAVGLFLGTMMAVEAQRQQGINYCMSRFRSYDPNSMTYVGRDGRRHRCP